MDGSADDFDPVLIGNMAAAFEAATSQSVPPCADNPAARFTIARRIVSAARAGERDRHRLELAGSSQTAAEQLPIAHRSSS
jgi:hypothetical protein